MKHMNKEEPKSYGDTLPLGYTYDAHGNELTYKDSNGYWSERTRDAHGRVLTYKNSYGYWSEYTRDAQGRELTCKDSNGYWSEHTYDAQGGVLTYKDSDGDWSGFSNEEIDKERARLKQVRKQLKRSKK